MDYGRAIFELTIAVFVLLYAFWAIAEHYRHSRMERVLPKLSDSQDFCHDYQINC